MAITAVVCNSGLSVLTGALKGSGLGTVYIALGTGAGTASVSDTAMFTEDTTTGRTAATLAEATTNQTNDTLTATATPTTTVSSETVTELGLFTASTGGTMIAHASGYSQPFGTSSGTSSATFELNIVL